MKLEGGCYCGQVRYEVEGEPRMRAQCHCRECQYLTGGGPNFFMLFAGEGFRYLKGEPKAFARTDLERPVSREFCANCGAQMVSRPFGYSSVVLKVGTLDDPSVFGVAEKAIYLIDKQPFHVIAEGVPTAERSTV